MTNLDEEIDLFTNTPLKEGYKAFDVITELMLHQGYPLDSRIDHSNENENSLWIVEHEDVPSPLVVCLDEKLHEGTGDFLFANFEKATFVCLDDALTNKQKILLSEAMNVKTI